MRFSMPAKSRICARRSFRISPLFLILAFIPTLPSRAADQKSDLNLASFRALVKDQSSAEKQQANLERAGEVFFRLLAAQGKLAAARQSLDRLSGWYKAAQARFQAQNAPALDVELLRFSEAKAAERVAEFEAERLAAVEEANLLLKRPAASPLVGALDTQPAPAAPESKPNAAGAAPPPEPGPDFASRRAAFEKELLPLGNALMGKMYQSYLFGGIPVTSLLSQERELFNTELHYRLLLVEEERRSQPK